MRVSVALCTYNGAAHVKELLQSIARQSILPDEMVISDDASTDGTVEILEQFGRDQSFPVRIYKSKNTRGVNRNYEFAICQCMGDLIFIADQDDVWLENKIKVLSGYIAESNHSAIFSDAEMIDAQGELMNRRIWDYFKFDFADYQKHGELLKRNLLSNVVTGSTLAIKRDILQLIMPFPESDEFLYDEWLTLVILNMPDKSILPLDIPAMQYRFHEGQFTAKLRTPVESQFPFNRKVVYDYIKRKQQLLALLKSHHALLDQSTEQLDAAYQFWDARLLNHETFSFVIKLYLFFSFPLGKYHKYVHWPVKSWIKDIIA